MKSLSIVKQDKTNGVHVRSVDIWQGLGYTEHRVEGGKDADDPSGTVGVARGTRLRVWKHTNNALLPYYIIYNKD